MHKAPTCALREGGLHSRHPLSLRTSSRGAERTVCLVLLACQARGLVIQSPLFIHSANSSWAPARSRTLL